MPIATVNPANGETLKTFEALGAAEIEHRLATADTTFRSTAPPHSVNGPGCSTRPPTSSTRTSRTSPAP